MEIDHTSCAEVSSEEFLLLQKINSCDFECVEEQQKVKFTIDKIVYVKKEVVM